jgi:hypothetical protein
LRYWWLALLWWEVDRKLPAALRLSPLALRVLLR